MTEFGIPIKLISLVKICTIGSRSRIKIDGTLSECFDINSSLKQGDALSPLLFNNALEKVIRDTKPRQQILSPRGTSLVIAYADDIDIHGNDYSNVGDLFTILESKTKKAGLQVNVDKTKYVHVSRISRATLPSQMTLGNRTFKRISGFRYLGSLGTSDNNTQSEINSRILNTWKCVNSLKKLLCSRVLNRKVKIQLCQSMIRPLTGSETWTMTKLNQESLKRCERKLIRIIFGPVMGRVTGQYRIRSNQGLRNLYNEPDIVHPIKAKRL